MRRAAFVLLLSCAAGLASPARAQDSKAAAEAVFDEGVKAFEAGDFATACPKLAAAVRLTRRESLGGLLLLAECEEKRGNTATAWATYREVSTKAARAAQGDREATAREGEARLAPLLHRVALRVAPEVASLAGLEITRSGETVPADALGVALPADPGTLVIRVQATGRKPHERSVPIPATPGSTEVTIGASDLPVDPLATKSGSASSPSSGTGSETGGGGMFYGGLVTAGVGVIGIAISTALIASAKGDYDEAVTPCPDGVCPTTDQKAAVDDAQSSGDVATIVFAGGVGLAAIGGALMIIDLASSSPSATSSASLRVAPGRLDLAGTWCSSRSALTEFRPGVWSTPRPARFFGLETGTRMSIVRLADGGLFVHSPVALDAETRAEVDALGPVRAVVAPSIFHHLHVGGWIDAYPDAVVAACPGLELKRADLKWTQVLGDQPHPVWGDEIEQVYFSSRRENEVDFFHRASGTFISADALLNLSTHQLLSTRIVARVMGNIAPGVGWMEPLMVRDRRVARRQVDRMLEWEIDGVLLAHGQPLERGGRQALEHAYAWL